MKPERTPRLALSRVFLTLAPPAWYCKRSGALGSAGQSAWFTPRMSQVQILQRPFEKPCPLPRTGLFKYQGDAGFDPSHVPSDREGSAHGCAERGEGGLERARRKRATGSQILQRPFEKPCPLPRTGLFKYQGDAGFDPILQLPPIYDSPLPRLPVFGCN